MLGSILGDLRLSGGGRGWGLGNGELASVLEIGVAEGWLCLQARLPLLCAHQLGRQSLSPWTPLSPSGLAWGRGGWHWREGLSLQSSSGACLPGIWGVAVGSTRVTLGGTGSGWRGKVTAGSCLPVLLEDNAEASRVREVDSSFSLLSGLLYA